jgi:hypothetical protein
MTQANHLQHLKAEIKNVYNENLRMHRTINKLSGNDILTRLYCSGYDISTCHACFQLHHCRHNDGQQCKFVCCNCYIF